MQVLLKTQFKQHPLYQFHSRNAVQQLARNHPACWLMVDALSAGHLQEIAHRRDWLEIFRAASAYEAAFALAYESVNTVIDGELVGDVWLSHNPTTLFAWWQSHDVSGLAINRPIDGMGFMNWIGYQLQMASEQFEWAKRIAA